MMPWNSSHWMVTAVAFAKTTSHGGFRATDWSASNYAKCGGLRHGATHRERVTEDESNELSDTRDKNDCGKLTISKDDGRLHKALTRPTKLWCFAFFFHDRFVNFIIHGSHDHSRMERADSYQLAIL